MKTWIFCTTAACLMTVPSAMAALKVGDAAPEIRVAKWAQGEEVKKFEGDKVYIVEFWATWCGPCIASIPHLDGIYRKYKGKGLVVIGQNLGENAAKVSPFVKSMAGKMSYRVTIDDPTEDGWMAKHWLAAAGQNGIPCAFVVGKKGKIAFIGHPMELKESLLEQLLAEPSLEAEGSTAGGEPATPGAKASKLAALADGLIRSGKTDEAETVIAELQESLPSNFAYIGGLLELDVLLAKKQPDDGIALSRILVEDFGKNPTVMAALASHLVSRPDATPALQSTAEKIAKPLSLAEGDSRGSALATLARIASLRGDKGGAEELNSKAAPLLAKSHEAAAKAGLGTSGSGSGPMP